MNLVGATVDTLNKRVIKNAVNGTEFNEWLQLSEAIRPIDTVFGKWPDCNDGQWHQPTSYQTYTFFIQGDAVFMVSVVGDDIYFASSKLSWTRARAKDNPKEAVQMMSVEASNSIVSYAGVANVFGKVLFITKQFLLNRKPKVLEFNGASEGLSSIYRRAFKSPSVVDFFSELGYALDKSYDEVHDGKKLSFFKIVRK